MSNNQVEALSPGNGIAHYIWKWHSNVSYHMCKFGCSTIQLVKGSAFMSATEMVPRYAESPWPHGPLSLSPLSSRRANDFNPAARLLDPP
ncbi:hypothetical protein CLAIMM_08416 isoform 2 [Cladophialophora immunda]|nr:hypothetical protein CLAIMM_08416 isoform 2 [Cladophialophora immunda]